MPDALCNTAECKFQGIEIVGVDEEDVGNIFESQCNF